MLMDHENVSPAAGDLEAFLKPAANTPSNLAGNDDAKRRNERLRVDHKQSGNP
jgi:hypothetical protein